MINLLEVAALVGMAGLVLAVVALVVVVKQVSDKLCALASQILVYAAHDKGGMPMAAQVLGATKLAGIATGEREKSLREKEKPREKDTSGDVVITSRFL